MGFITSFDRYRFHCYSHIYCNCYSFNTGHQKTKWVCTMITTTGKVWQENSKSMQANSQKVGLSQPKGAKYYYPIIPKIPEHLSSNAEGLVRSLLSCWKLLPWAKPWWRPCLAPASEYSCEWPPRSAWQLFRQWAMDAPWRTARRHRPCLDQQNH